MNARLEAASPSGAGRDRANLYLAYPGSDVLVEVFSPGGVLGQRLVLSGAVARVGDKASPMPAPRQLARPAGLSR